VAEIVRGSISIDDAEDWAISRIREKALVLGKIELLMEPRGRKKRRKSALWLG